MSGTSMRPFTPLAVPISPDITLVEASAGTGKTLAITRLVLRLLLQDPDPIRLDRIAVVTFTEKGTNELITRIRAVLRTAAAICSDRPPAPTPETADLFPYLRAQGTRARDLLDLACTSLDLLRISTIHGFCLRILSEYALETGVHFDVEFVQNDTELITRAAHDWTRRTVVPDIDIAKLVAGGKTDPARWAGDLVRPASSHPNVQIEAAPSPVGDLLKGYVTAVQRGARLERSHRHLLTFEDLLRKLWEILKREGKDGLLASRIRSHFRAALIDEFQDTDPFQFPIFETAFAGCPLFLIGDPKQSIYAFRGADVRAYLGAAQRAAHRYTLTQNFRSTPEMVEAVHRLFTNVETPFGAEGQITFPEVHSAEHAKVPEALKDDGRQALHWVLIEDDRSAPTSKRGGSAIPKDQADPAAIAATVQEIDTLLRRGLPAKDIAILVRENRHAREYKAALDRVRIPAVVASDRDVLDSDEGAELIHLGLAIADPANDRLVRGALATRLWGATADEIAAMIHGKGQQDWGEVLRRFRFAQERWVKSGIATGLSVILEYRQTITRLLGLPDGERRVTNLRHLLELFRDEGDGSAFPPAAFDAWVTRERLLTSVPERREQRLESDAFAVQIMTIHKAKGLQWPIVFCPTLWNIVTKERKVLGEPYAIATFPDPTIDDPEQTVRRIDIGTDAPTFKETRDRATRHRADEEMRLTYVALTRAKVRTYLVWGPLSSADRSALATLLGGPEVEHVTTLVATYPSVMSVETLPLSGQRPSVPRAAETRTEPMLLARSARTFSPTSAWAQRWSSSSYSSLTSGGHETGWTARDTDDPPLLRVDTTPDAPSTGAFAIKKGTEIGEALHELLEHLDFPDARSIMDLERALSVERIQTALKRYGIAPSSDGRWSEADIHGILRDTCLTTIPGTTFALADVPMADTLREWHFTIPVAGFDREAIATAIEAHGSETARPYAERVRRMRKESFEGYLTGIVDLAFEHDGRWWIVDWKSNHLGDTAGDYDAATMQDAMHQHDYTLQYLLYLVALHRHLRARIMGYDPATHWGGIAYVFLRGVVRDQPTGWYRDMPTPALIEALDHALRSPAP